MRRSNSPAGPRRNAEGSHASREGRLTQCLRDFANFVPIRGPGSVRRLLLVTLALLGLAAGPAGAGPVFFVTGHGWGHGIGMSQYGAQGFAQHGWTHDQILTHYYSGTSVLPLGSSPR